jgi:hypothetical protein
MSETCLGGSWQAGSAVSPGPGLPKGPTNWYTLDWGCANLDELPVPVLIGRQHCLLNCSNQQAWESGQRSGEEEAGSALGHGELFRPRQAHEQSRQTVSPAFPSSYPASFDPRATPIAVTRVFFQNGDFISFRSTNRAVWAFTASN